jgi:hypothetical protein
VYAMDFVHLPVGVRNIGMGGTGTSDASGLATGHFNPASVAFSDATLLAGSYEDAGTPFELDLTDVVISSPIPFHSSETPGPWKFAGALGYTRLGMEPQIERTIFLPEGTGSTFEASDWGITALGAASWTSGVTTLAVGATGKFLKTTMDSDIASRSSEAWALDLGTLAAFPVHFDGGMIRPRLGLAVTNLDTGGESDDRLFEVANVTRAGVGLDVHAAPVEIWDRTAPLAALSFDYDRIDSERNSDREFSAGFEVSFINLLHFRYGVADSDFTMYGVGFGWDYGPVLFRLDYAHQEPEDEFLELLDYNRDTFGGLIGVRW